MKIHEQEKKLHPAFPRENVGLTETPTHSKPFSRREKGPEISTSWWVGENGRGGAGGWLRTLCDAQKFRCRCRCETPPHRFPQFLAARSSALSPVSTQRERSGLHLQRRRESQPTYPPQVCRPHPPPTTKPPSPTLPSPSHPRLPPSGRQRSACHCQPNLCQPASPSASQPTPANALPASHSQPTRCQLQPASLACVTAS